MLKYSHPGDPKIGYFSTRYHGEINEAAMAANIG